MNNNLKLHVYIQAREGSERLPSKILKKICNKSILELILERVKEIKTVEKIILITGSEGKNTNLINEAKRLDLEYFCGNDNNVIDRFYNASKLFGSKNIIRITGDCPLIDFNIVNKGVEIFERNEKQIVSINRIRTFPDGFDFEIFNVEILKESWYDLQSQFTKTGFEQSFIPPTKYLLEKEKFIHYDLKNDKNLSEIRLTLDYLEDFELINIIYNKLYSKNKKFAMNEILELLNKNQELLDINKKYVIKDYGIKVENNSNS
jgi:spore coat polysaccharide biosynthesis protein SpsF